MKHISSILGTVGALMIAGSAFFYLITGDLSLAGKGFGFAGAALVLFFVYTHIDGLLESLGSRSTRYSSFAIVLTLLFGVMLGLLNFIAYKHPKRYDTTENKAHSLSDQSVKVVAALKEPIQITTFFVMDSPARAKFKDLYDAYLEHTDKLNVTYIEVERDPVAVKQFAITQPDTVVLGSGPNERRLTELSEEKLTNAIISVTREGQKQICFLEGHGEKSIGNSEPDGLSEAKTALEKQSFTARAFALYKEGAIPDTCHVLVVAGPTRPLFEQELPLLQQWVKNGGRLIYMIDPGVDAKVAEPLLTWGITAHDDLVVDPVAQSFFGNAAVPVGVPAGMNKIVDGLKESPAFFPLARSLELANPAPSNGYFETLLKTASDQAWGETDPAIVRPVERGAPTSPSQDASDIQGPLVLAALLNLPVEAPAKPAPAEGEAPSEDAAEDKERKAMVMVVGDSDFATNDYFHNSVNGDLLLNAISYLAEEEDLLAIRPKEASKQTVSMTKAQGNFIFYMSLFIVPGLPLIMGIYTFLAKRNL